MIPYLTYFGGFPEFGLQLGQYWELSAITTTERKSHTPRKASGIQGDQDYLKYSVDLGRDGAKSMCPPDDAYFFWVMSVSA